MFDAPTITLIIAVSGAVISLLAYLYRKSEQGLVDRVDANEKANTDLAKTVTRIQTDVAVLKHQAAAQVKAVEKLEEKLDELERSL